MCGCVKRSLMPALTDKDWTVMLRPLALAKWKVGGDMLIALGLSEKCSGSLRRHQLTDPRVILQQNVVRLNALIGSDNLNELERTFKAHGLHLAMAPDEIAWAENALTFNINEAQQMGLV